MHAGSLAGTHTHTSTQTHAHLVSREVLLQFTVDFFFAAGEAGDEGGGARAPRRVQARRHEAQASQLVVRVCVELAVCVSLCVCGSCERARKCRLVSVLSCFTATATTTTRQQGSTVYAHFTLFLGAEDFFFLHCCCCCCTCEWATRCMCVCVGVCESVLVYCLSQSPCPCTSFLFSFALVLRVSVCVCVLLAVRLCVCE